MTSYMRTALAAFGFSLLLAWQFTMGVASAASFAPKGFDELVREAEQIFIGTAGAAISRYNERRLIVSDVRFDDVQMLKGNAAPRSITLTLLGGKIGDLEMAIHGAPEFQRGVRYLVFSAGNGSVMFPMVGGPQGIFQIRDDAGGEASRVHDFNGQPVIVLPARPQAAVSEIGPAQATASGAALSVDEFKAAILRRMNSLPVP